MGRVISSRHFLSTAVFLFACSSWAGYTYEGTLTDENDNPISTPRTLKLRVMSPAPSSCVLYEEIHPTVTPAADGYFSLNIGSGNRNDGGAHPLAQVFDNAGGVVTGLTNCANGNSYTPAPGDSRQLQVLVSPDGTTFESLGAMILNPMPWATNAERVGGFTPASLLRFKDAAGVPAPVAAMSVTDFADLQLLINGTSPKYLKSSATAGAALPPLSTPPSTPTAGTIWFDSTSHNVKFYDGTTTQALSSGGGLTSLTVSSALTANGTSAGTLSSPGVIDLNNTGVTAGSYSKVTVDAKGRVMTGSTLIESDLPVITSAGKVNGNAVTGNLTVANVVATGLTVASTANVTFTGTGNVGVGTSSPAAPLHVISTTGPAVLAANSSPTGPSLQIGQMGNPISVVAKLMQSLSTATCTPSGSVTMGGSTDCTISGVTPSFPLSSNVFLTCTVPSFPWVIVHCSYDATNSKLHYWVFVPHGAPSSFVPNSGGMAVLFTSM